MASQAQGKGVQGWKKRFSTPWLNELAGQIETEFGEAFQSYGATFKVTPMSVNRLTEVGEGVELSLFPHDPKTWEWWGDFESGIEVARRKRFSRKWQEILSREEVTSWARSETEAYLAQLSKGTAS